MDSSDPDFSDPDFSDPDFSDSSFITRNLSNDSSDIDHVEHGEHKFSSLEFILNSFLHVSILFFFLYVLFIIIISPLEKKAFKIELGKIINDIIDKIIPNKIDVTDNEQLDSVLNNVNGYSKLSDESKITIRTNIQLLYSNIKANPYILNNYLSQYQNENFLVKQHNDSIINYGQSLVIFLFTITTLLIIVIKYYYPDSVNVKNLLLENLITFIFIGAGEYMFFMNYAKNFVPAPPSLLSKTAIDNIKTTFDVISL